VREQFQGSSDRLWAGPERVAPSGVWCVGSVGMMERWSGGLMDWRCSGLLVPARHAASASFCIVLHCSAPSGTATGSRGWCQGARQPGSSSRPCGRRGIRLSLPSMLIDSAHPPAIIGREWRVAPLLQTTNLHLPPRPCLVGLAPSAIAF